MQVPDCSYTYFLFHVADCTEEELDQLASELMDSVDQYLNRDSPYTDSLDYFYNVVIAIYNSSRKEIACYRRDPLTNEKGRANGKYQWYERVINPDGSYDRKMIPV